MYYFYRKELKSGKMFLKDKDGDKLVVKVVSARDNARLIDLHDYDYVKSKYPKWILTADELELALLDD